MSVPHHERRGRVLVAWDGSETGRRALLHAARVVGRGGRVAVVNVVRAQSIGSRLQTVSDEARAEQQAVLEQAAVLLAQSGVQAELVAATGDPVTEIEAAAKRFHADTVVVGRSGRRGLHAGVADRLVRRGGPDVLVVR
jgi:nucleotide-binding universal stress UspA family protein